MTPRTYILLSLEELSLVFKKATDNSVHNLPMDLVFQVCICKYLEKQNKIATDFSRNLKNRDRESMLSNITV